MNFSNKESLTPTNVDKLMKGLTEMERRKTIQWYIKKEINRIFESKKRELPTICLNYPWGVESFCNLRGNRWYRVALTTIDKQGRQYQLEGQPIPTNDQFPSYFNYLITANNGQVREANQPKPIKNIDRLKNIYQLLQQFPEQKGQNEVPQSDRIDNITFTI